MRVQKAGVIGIVMGLVVPVVGQAPPRHGRWEVRSEIEMPGMPMKMPGSTSIQCITPADAADPQKAVPADPKGKCAVSNFREIDDTKVAWDAKCDTGSGTGEIVYANDGTYVGALRLMVTELGREMVIKLNGKRLGDCVQ
jgi:hypothetical protein